MQPFNFQVNVLEKDTGLRFISDVYYIDPVNDKFLVYKPNAGFMWVYYYEWGMDNQNIEVTLYKRGKGNE